VRAIVNGIALSYTLEGPADAPVVTLSHALGAAGALFDAQAAQLRPRYRVLRYDARGHGASDVPPGPYTLSALAADALGLLDHLGIERTHFVGLSMGGLVGMAAALAAPARIRSLVLCDTTACYGEAGQAMWRERLRTVETEGLTEALIERTLEIWFSPRFRAEAPAAVDRVRAMLRATDPGGYAAAARAIGFVDLRDQLAAIRCPTLVVVGADDPGTPPAMARELAARIPGARLLVLPGVRHCSVVEAAAALAPELEAFLAAA